MQNGHMDPLVCPDCRVLLRDGRDAFECPECGHRGPYDDVNRPDGADDLPGLPSG